LSGTALLRLHHVGYAVKTIEPMAEAYVQRYGYELSTGIIHDQLQTAFVQFLKLAEDSAYLEFVAPDGQGSTLTTAARKSGGLNHLCYTAGPLEETIAALGESGMRLISEPKAAVAFNGRRICWLVGDDPLPIELVERRSDDDRCEPGL
jgi:methylmalonyl-CoA/ethylmalonyl-CoA epimerase